MPMRAQAWRDDAPAVVVVVVVVVVVGLRAIVREVSKGCGSAWRRLVLGAPWPALALATSTSH